MLSLFFLVNIIYISFPNNKKIRPSALELALPKKFNALVLLHASIERTIPRYSRVFREKTEKFLGLTIVVRF